MVADSLAKLPILKLSLHNSAAVCLRQKLRRGLSLNNIMHLHLYILRYSKTG